MVLRLRFVTIFLYLANNTTDAFPIPLTPSRNTATIGLGGGSSSGISSQSSSVTKLYNVVTKLEEEEEEKNGQERRFMHMTKEQDQLLKEKGEYEQSLMKKPVPLKPNKVRGAAGGFGGGGGAKKKTGNKKAKSSAETNKDSRLEENLLAVQSHAKALATDGLVRIDNVLSAELADALRDYLCDLRARSTAEIEEGEIADSQERFADVLLNQNRCDLKIPLGPAPVNNALYHLFAKEEEEESSSSSSSTVRDVMEYVFESYEGNGKDAELWELNCFMSNSGARRQLVHADNVCLEPVIGLKNENEPIVLTCFVALQDIDETMGPTVWMPGTHTLHAHNQFFETGIDQSSTPRTDDSSSYSPKDEILQSSKAVVGTIPKGACVIFDPRVLHCAGGNTCPDPTNTRALFYVSFKNPKIDNPGCPSTCGYGVATAEITMEDLTTDLKAEQEGLPTRKLQLISCFP
jgi:hypothetical protein